MLCSSRRLARFQSEQPRHCRCQEEAVGFLLSIRHPGWIPAPLSPNAAVSLFSFSSSLQFPNPRPQFSNRSPSQRCVIVVKCGAENRKRWVIDGEIGEKGKARRRILWEIARARRVVGEERRRSGKSGGRGNGSEGMGGGCGCEWVDRGGSWNGGRAANGPTSGLGGLGGPRVWEGVRAVARRATANGGWQDGQGDRERRRNTRPLTVRLCCRPAGTGAELSGARRHALGLACRARGRWWLMAGPMAASGRAGVGESAGTPRKMKTKSVALVPAKHGSCAGYQRHSRAYWVT